VADGDQVVPMVDEAVMDSLLVPISINNSVVMIPLHDYENRVWATVDAIDAEAIQKFAWFKHRVDGYALTKTDGRLMSMHRYIMWDAPKNQVIDHINGNRLDNRRCNLRAVTTAENGRNRQGANRNNQSSGVRNVSLDKRSGKWRVHCRKNGKDHWGGSFDSLDIATRAAEALRKCLGFPRNTKDQDC